MAPKTAGGPCLAPGDEKDGLDVRSCGCPGDGAVFSGYPRGLCTRVYLGAADGSCLMVLLKKRGHNLDAPEDFTGLAATEKPP